MKIIKPKKLKKGDTIGIIAVSGQIRDISKIEKAKHFFEQEGYNVIISDTCYSSHRYMAGNNDDSCIKTLHDFFLNREIDAIICARGGYGTLRLLNKINWEIIRKNPKIFAGYSDISILLAMFYKKTGLICFHSPMPNGDFSDKINDYTKNSFFNTLTGKTTEISSERKTIYNKGIARGKLWGGNLSSIVSLAGLDFIPDGEIVLFAEDLNEPAYKIDKMFTQLFNIDKIKRNIKGIAIGEFQNIDNNSYFNDILSEIALNYNIPVCSGFNITHGKQKDTIPYGINVLFNSEKGFIKFEEEYID